MEKLNRHRRSPAGFVVHVASIRQSPIRNGTEIVYQRPEIDDLRAYIKSVSGLAFRQNN
ncbi:unnamed protein product [Arabidopsis halleri]